MALKVQYSGFLYGPSFDAPGPTAMKRYAYYQFLQLVNIFLGEYLGPELMNLMTERQAWVQLEVEFWWPQQKGVAVRRNRSIQNKSIFHTYFNIYMIVRRKRLSIGHFFVFQTCIFKKKDVIILLTVPFSSLQRPKPWFKAYYSIIILKTKLGFFFLENQYSRRQRFIIPDGSTLISSAYLLFLSSRNF